MTRKSDQVVLQYEFTLREDDAQSLKDVWHYWRWRTKRRKDFREIHFLDDVDIRSYLLHLKLNDQDAMARKRVTDSLRHFYSWAMSEKLITASPFEQFDYDRPLLSREEIRRRPGSLQSNPANREIDRLRALHQLAEQLNRTHDIPTMLKAALETLVDVLRLTTTWVFIWDKAGLTTSDTADNPLHDFRLTAHCGLPEGLKVEGNRFLCQSPDCRCQVLLRDGRLVRAVNVVECTRLYDAAKASTDTANLFFHATVPLIAEGNPLGILNVATENWEFLSSADLQMLTAAGFMIATALQRADFFHVVEAQRKRLANELEMAHHVQASLIPADLPLVDGFSTAAHWQSAAEVAGDFYDIIELSNGSYVFVLADVSGKGAPAALYMAMARSLVRSESRRFENPSDVLREVNRRLLAESSSAMFVTIFYAILNPKDGLISYCNAGHDPPILRLKSTETKRLPYGGHFLGVFENPDLEDKSLSLKNGDSLVVFTDGLVDAINSELEQYGLSRLMVAVQKAPPGATGILSFITNEVAEFVGDEPPIDDITAIVISRK